MVVIFFNQLYFSPVGRTESLISLNKMQNNSKAYIKKSLCTSQFSGSDRHNLIVYLITNFKNPTCNLREAKDENKTLHQGSIYYHSLVLQNGL